MKRTCLVYNHRKSENRIDDFDDFRKLLIAEQADDESEENIKEKNSNRHDTSI